MDLNLLAAAADMRPDYHFIMVGPVVKIAESDLPKRANIHYLGGKSYKDGAYIATFAGFVPADLWLKKKPRNEKDVKALVLRYLEAYGPATAADAQTWSGVPSLAGVFETLRKKLVVLKDEKGRELFDLPDAPRPDEGARSRCCAAVGL